MINEDLKNRIKDAIDIVEVVGNYVSLKRAGKNHVGVCPFHDDKSPSMSVSPAKQIFRCYSCGAGGDVFEFVSKIENKTFPEAVKQCADKVNIDFEVKELTPEEIQQNRERESLQIAIEAATCYYESKLPEAQKYMTQRGYNLDSETIKDFRIGYAPEGNVLCRDLQASGYLIEYLIKVNVADKGHYDPYDVFRDRIMFPFMDLNGRVVGFSGRFVVKKENTGKYINTSDTSLFVKGHAVFGLYQARAEIGRRNNAYLLEGQFDVTSLHLHGVKNAIAGSGTALTDSQIKLIGRFTRNVTMIYDGDAAGIKASLKNTQALLHFGINVKCVQLPEGKDPDNMATKLKEKTEAWLLKATTDFVTYFSKVLNVDPSDPIKTSEAYTAVATLIAQVQDESQRNQYSKILSDCFGQKDDLAIARKKVRDLRKKAPRELPDVMAPGIYGMEDLKTTLQEFGSVNITSNFEEFLCDVGDYPTVYIHGRASTSQIQELRKSALSFTTTNKGLSVDNGIESNYLMSLADCYRAGISDLRVIETLSSGGEDDDEPQEKTYTFLNYYLRCYQLPIKFDEMSRAFFIDRCGDLISYASESERIVNSTTFQELLGLKKGQLDSILKPFLEKRKSRLAINSQREDESEEYDPDEVPSYVEENPEYKEMYRNYGYYPRLNKEGEPVAYMFKNEKGGHTLVSDFYMIPLLHIYDEKSDCNLRIFKINRRYYKKPFFMEFRSGSLVKRSMVEDVIINQEAMNFDNGTDQMWLRIKSCMSRKYTTCTEAKVYGQQTENFYAFANAIFHEVEGTPIVEYTDEMGVVKHADKNYYLPAFSTIHIGARKDDDKFEKLRSFVYKDIPAEKQCSFEHWTTLMDQVYKINDNGKWAIIYAIMCAFRSDIHSIDRLFTALFFMGPTMSGKTQIAISIRSLYINPELPAFNLNTGTDAAFSTIMGCFRDVPVVLEEYNNRDISDVKFQALKSITYDGDGKEKRKGTSGKDTETDKVYTPVIISGQETPQRDDNALMNRVIVCEVPKMGLFTEESKSIFNELKQVEKDGLSNILFEILKLRPLIRKHFKPIQRQISKDLSEKVLIGSNSSGDMVRIINTVSLFLTTCKILFDYAPQLKLPFTYDEFLEIASKKVINQVELISHTDKLAMFFKSMDVMVSTKTLKYGRDFDIDAPGRLTIKLSGNERQEKTLRSDQKVLFLRMSSIYTLFAKSSYNTESASQSTIEQNLRSNPAYLGVINARRFRWKEVEEVPMSSQSKDADPKENNTMIRVMESKETTTSCIAIDYDIFKSFYDIDLERDSSPKIEGEIELKL